MPDDAAKGFARSVSLEAAAAEGAKLCASPLQPPHTHTPTPSYSHSSTYFNAYNHPSPAHATALCVHVMVVSAHAPRISPHSLDSLEIRSLASLSFVPPPYGPE